MSDVTAITIGEIDAIRGVLEGITFHKAAGALGVSAFGLSVVDLEPGASSYPEHDHSEEGIGGRMFAKRPQQLGQEEVYFALRGSGTVEADGKSYPLDADHAVRVGRRWSARSYRGRTGCGCWRSAERRGSPMRPAAPCSSLNLGRGFS